MQLVQNYENEVRFHATWVEAQSKMLDEARQNAQYYGAAENEVRQNVNHENELGLNVTWVEA